MNRAEFISRATHDRFGRRRFAPHEDPETDPRLQGGGQMFRIRNILLKNGLSLDDALAMSDAELLGLEHVGEATVRSLRSAGISEWRLAAIRALDALLG
jgi:hypothetical protein